VRLSVYRTEVLPLFERMRVEDSTTAHMLKRDSEATKRSHT